MYLLLGHLRYFYRSFFNKNIKTIHTKKSPSLFNHSFKPLFSVNGEEMNAFSYYLVNKTKYNYLIYIYILWSLLVHYMIGLILEKDFL